MIKIATFVSTSIIEFILTLNTVKIPETDLTILGFMVMLTATKMIFAFIFEFFRMQRNFRQQQFKGYVSNSYYKLNDKLLDTRTNLRSSIASSPFRISYKLNLRSIGNKFRRK